MNKNEQRKRRVPWIIITVGAVVLVGLATLPLQLARTVKTIPIRVDSKFTPWLGPISIQNETVRNWVLSTAHRVCPNGMVELVAPEGYPDIRSMDNSCRLAGLPIRSMTIRHEAASE